MTFAVYRVINADMHITIRNTKKKKPEKKIKKETNDSYGTVLRDSGPVVKKVNSTERWATTT